MILLLLVLFALSLAMFCYAPLDPQIVRMRTLTSRFVSSLSDNPDPRAAKLAEFDVSRIRQVRGNARGIAFTENKDVISVCVDGHPRDDHVFFVILHELAHVLTDTWDHTPEFWGNMRWIVSEAIARGYLNISRNDDETVCGESIVAALDPYRRSSPIQGP